MRHSLEELFNIAYQYYPRGMEGYDERYRATPEYGRLVAARRNAGSAPMYPRWEEMLERLGAANFSPNLPASTGWDAGYWAQFMLSGRDEPYHAVGFLVSFLVPYYVLYVSYPLPIEQAIRTPSGLKRRNGTRFSFEVDEQPYAAKTMLEIKATFGEDFEAMPPEIGLVILPDAAADGQRLGETTLFDCFFTDAWVPKRDALQKR